MPEAEELLTDAARHLTVFAHGLWVRHRGRRSAARSSVELVDVARRMELLVHAVWGRRLTVRHAQPPAPGNAVGRWLRGERGPRNDRALPSTDGAQLWLPSTLEDPHAALERYRALALLQAMRAVRGAPAVWAEITDPLVRDVYLLLEARACEEALVRALPGLEQPIRAVRHDALSSRPPLEAFPPARRPLELLARAALADTLSLPLPSGEPAEQLLPLARTLASSLGPRRRGAPSLLLKDHWTGELRAPPPPSSPRSEGQQQAGHPPPRSARLPRRPEVREATEGEDDRDPGAWMVQTSAPQEKAEDPMGLQRPIDHDLDAAAEELADAVSELDQARLVRTPSPAKEVLLSDDAPALEAGSTSHAGAIEALRYPEWDYRTTGYHPSGAKVRVLAAPEGPQAWVDLTMRAHRPMLQVIRRRFELLRAERGRLRRRLDGDDLDLEACVQSEADFAAGRSRSQALYQLQRPLRRSVAVLLLVDASGSTDAWIAAQRRVVDVEREALLLVSVALDVTGDPFAIQSFSGEGREGVVVRDLKSFKDRFDEATSLRIAGLEPEHYTRAGAALRHAAATLVRQPAAHRLLILLSDGKPNDGDLYEGRYGIEDTRQAVAEARAQGIYPFCLTIDHQGPEYLGRIFGPGGFALLPKPELLPQVLLDWLKRLVAG